MAAPLKKPHPLPPVTDPVIEIIIKGTSADGGAGLRPCQNVFYYRQTTLSAAINKTNVASGFRAKVIVPLLLAANVRYTPNAVTIRNVQDVADFPSRIVQAGAGAIATDSLPSDSAVAFILTSNTRGKMCLGRKHFGMANEIDTTQDVLTGAGLTNWGNMRGPISTPFMDLDGNVWTPFILSRTAKFTSFITPVVIFGANCTGARLILNVGTMRRRRSKTLYAA